MNNYVIFTDSACDIIPETLAEWNVLCLKLIFRFDGEDKEYLDGDIEIKEFYDRMRDGAVAKTSALNSQIFTEAFEPCLAEGKDVLYLGFSSGLSTTFNSARLAAEALREKYPERKIEVVDSLCASAGAGLFVYLVNQKRNEGASLEDAAAYAEEIKSGVCHYFTVDDLVYLKRGGRISAASAFFGNALGIKPVLHVDDAGHLVPVAKIRGRKAAVKMLADKYTELSLDPANGTVFISHGDCLSEAEGLADMLREKHGASVDIITNIGTVIGAHAGPGTLALFFIGKER